MARSPAGVVDCDVVSNGCWWQPVGNPMVGGGGGVIRTGEYCELNVEEADMSNFNYDGSNSVSTYEHLYKYVIDHTV